jgi:hypothetical protein
MGLLEKGHAIQRYNISRGQVKDGMATVSGPTVYAFNDDEFVWVEVDGQPIAIRWSSIESYETKRAL